MSVPPGTEMFQFPGFASLHYEFMQRYPCGWVAPFGYPRINACSRLPVAFRSVPRPSSPPGAKASTECPCHTRYRGPSTEAPGHTMHRNHPQTQSAAPSRQLSETTATEPPSTGSGTVLEFITPHITGSSRMAASSPRSRNAVTHPSSKIVHTPLNPRRRPLGRRACAPAIPVRQVSRTTHLGQLPGFQSPPVGHSIPTPDDRSPATAMMTRPETHQNLIHSNKEHRHPDKSSANGTIKRLGTLCLSHDQTEFGTFRDTYQCLGGSVRKSDH